MIQILAKHWWLLVVRGLVSLAFAAAAFLMPKLTFELLVLLLGVLLLADGLVASLAALRLRADDDEWWIGLLEGLVGVGLGLTTLIKPEISAAVLVLFVSTWCLFTGALEVAIAIRIRKEVTGEWQLALAGILSIALGVLMLVQPNAGAISIAWYIGFYAFFFGLLLVGLGLRLRRWARNV